MPIFVSRVLSPSERGPATIIYYRQGKSLPLKKYGVLTYIRLKGQEKLTVSLAPIDNLAMTRRPQRP